MKIKFSILSCLFLALTACGDETNATADPTTPSTPTQPDPSNPESVYEPTPEEPDNWTVLYVPAQGSYGSQTFLVPAAQNWVNTGLFLQAGETASIRASGFWDVTGRRETSPEGNGNETERGCNIGQLVARLGHHFEDPEIHCIGFDGTLTADKDGIVFLSAIVSNDLGETYETRVKATGSIEVTVESEGSTVPTVRAVDVSDYDFTKVESGWVEIRGEHIILTLPSATAELDQTTLEAALGQLDTYYDQHTEMRGATPYLGQRIRFTPDPTAEGWWMLAGNPIRTMVDLQEAGEDVRISRAAEENNDNWGYAHELGHTFTMVTGLWTYQVGGALEAWPNLFTMHALEAIGHPQATREDCSVTTTEYFASGTYEELESDPWIGLCFLLEFHGAYGGWDFYTAFFHDLNNWLPFQVPYGVPAWSWVRDRFNAIAGEDTSHIFETWGVPVEPL